jgi:hypothetical protein
MSGSMSPKRRARRLAHERVELDTALTVVLEGDGLVVVTDVVDLLAVGAHDGVAVWSSPMWSCG